MALEQVLDDLNETGQSDVAMGIAETHQTIVDAISSLSPKRAYVTRTGVTLNLKPVSNMLIYQLQNDKFGMPQPPIIESRIGPKKIKVREANVNDPDYKKRLQEWEQERYNNFIMYIWARGISNEPSREDKERIKEVFPAATDQRMKYIWIIEQLADDDEVGELSEAIISQTSVTDKGIAEADARFQGDS